MLDVEGSKEQSTLRKTLQKVSKPTPSDIHVLLDCLGSAAHALSNTVTHPDQQRRIVTLETRWRRLLERVFVAESSPAEVNHQKPETTSTSAFPDRQMEKQALFTSSIAGPLFSSTSTFCGPADALELPSNVYVSKVLPTPPSEFHAFGDLFQTCTTLESEDILSYGKQSISTSKAIAQGQFESFGLKHDHTEAIFDQNNRLYTHSLQRSCIDNKKGISQNDVVNPEEPIVPEASSDTPEANLDFDFDEDLISALESAAPPDVQLSRSLLQLSDMQRNRLALSPFSSPSNTEQSLAKQISDTLREAILGGDLQPKQLIDGVRPDYSFARLTKAYNGTLPPTIAQAIRASQTQKVSPTQSLLG